MEKLNVSLEQWQVLRAVADSGSFQGAADQLCKSQSTVSYSVQRLQENLGVPLFKQKGRRAQLTDAGQMILRRARGLLDEAGKLEQTARDLADGWEPNINLMVDAIFPEAILLKALEAFAPQCPGTRVEVFTQSLSGSQDMIIQKEVDLGVLPLVPTGFMSNKLRDVEFILVTGAQHKMAAASHTITEQQLYQHRQIVVRDSGAYRRTDAGWLGAEQRWTVSHFRDSVSYLIQGLGFAFVPRHWAQPELDTGALVELKLESVDKGVVMTHLVYTDRNNAGPATRLLAEEIIKVSKV